VKKLKFNRSSLLLFAKKKRIKGAVLSTPFILFFIFTLLEINILYAQNQNSIWCFGDSAGIDFRNISSPLLFSTGMDVRGSCTSISDKNGNLLFYTGTKGVNAFNYRGLVFDRSNNVMLNGDSIEGESWYNEHLIIPFYNDSTKYYLFTLGVLGPKGVYYSIIDLSQNGGLGAVIKKNVALNTLDAWDAMAAIKHGNGRDWWLITKDYYYGVNGNNMFHVFLILSDTIIETIQSIGANAYGNSGNMSFSKSGKNFIFSTNNGVAEVLDFDRCTGVFSNPKIIFPGSNKWFVGSCFSPNENYVYLSTNDTLSQLFQYDLTVPNIISSQIVLASISHPLYSGGVLRLAPDNKIYWSNAWTNQITYIYPYQDTVYHPENMNLSVINSPDSPGVPCNFSLYSFYLGGKRTYWGLPNNPDYELGAVIGSICDSLLSGITNIDNKEYFRFFPNPFSKEVFLSLNNDDHGMLTVYNHLGQPVYHSSIGRENKFDFSFLKPGIYYFEIEVNGRRLNQKMIKMDE
jgi:hypothetical protein